MDDQPRPGVEERRKNFPADFKSLDDLRVYVGKAAEACDFSSDDIYHVQVAVDEAFSNIVEHAFEAEPKEDVDCICQITSSALTIILRDHGHPFDPEQIPGPPLSASLRERKKGGLGLFFMRKWMDEVRFEVKPCGEKKHPCNILTMIKLRKDAL